MNILKDTNHIPPLGEVVILRPLSKLVWLYCHLYSNLTFTATRSENHYPESQTFMNQWLLNPSNKSRRFNLD